MADGRSAFGGLPPPLEGYGGTSRRDKRVSQSREMKPLKRLRIRGRSWITLLKQGVNEMGCLGEQESVKKVLRHD